MYILQELHSICHIYCGKKSDININESINKDKFLDIETINTEWNNPELIFCYSSSLELFIDKLYLFKNPFILISHNEDTNMLDKYNVLLENHLLIRWISQNIVLNNKKLLSIANNINYTLQSIKEEIIKFIPKSFSMNDSKGKPLDYKLNEILKKNNGFYIELGANDGLRQSNTAFFEFYKDWSGLLIEPSLNAYEQCVKNRPRSKCYNYACVSDDYTYNEIKGDFNGELMSSVEGKRLLAIDPFVNSSIIVKTITLEKLLDMNNIKHIDLLSLDTEGYELNILKGLNLIKHRPRYILVELYNSQYEFLVEFLKSYNYSLHSNFSNYNKQDNPYWDGTHNDYLFIDNTIL